MHARTLFLLALLAPPAPALSSTRAALTVSPSIAHEAPASDERAELMRGVESIRTNGSPGSIAVWGEQAFVVVDGNGGGGTRVPLVGAGPMGKGRVVLFGHEYLSKDVLADAPTKTLVERLIEWAARERPEAGGAPRKLLVWDAGLAGVLDGPRFACVRATAEWTTQLANVDAVLATRSDFTDAEIDALRAFVRGGGALLSGKPGWGWMQVTGRELVTNEVNRIVAEAGLAFADGMCAPGAGKRFELGAPAELAHAGRAFAALAREGAKHAGDEGKREGEDAKRASDEAKHAGDEAKRASRDVKLDKKARRQALDVLMETLRVLPPDDALLRPKLVELARAPGAVRMPTPEKPVEPDDLRLRVALAFDAVELAHVPVETTVAHPSAAAFPGSVPKDAPRMKKEVELDLAVPRWHATGLYAAPGERVTVTVPEKALELGLEVRIGVHTDSIWDKPWPRMPEISRAWKLEHATTTIASPFGGLVELVVPRAKAKKGAKAERDAKPKSGTTAGGDDGSHVRVTIEGAVEAPLFVLGATTNEEWKRSLRTRPAPWAELATSKVVLAVPSEAIRALDDPQALMEWWDQILDAYADFAGLPHERESAERYVPDVMISAGYMHSGYPIMTFLDAVPDMTSLAKMKQGPWGLLHELGHNHQEDTWTFEGTGEVTNNVFVLYALDVLCERKDWSEGHDALKTRAKRTADYLAKGASYAQWCYDPFLALGMYVELREAFGWKPFTQVFVEERALAKAERPKSEMGKRDQWMTRFSRAVGRDLGPFFERWGVPVSAEARAALSELPKWDGRGEAQR
ncbi:MAG: hypothetical protein IPJ77_18920 [Planctomycetes bacterium]|nr:hypothetical protein [Planctomycetota bacterium]